MKRVFNMSDISLDELLEKISELEKGGKDVSPSSFKKEKKVPRSVTDFIKEFEIKAGDGRVPVYKLYYDYIAWERFQSTKLSKIEFSRQFSKFFESGRGNQGRYYKLDSNSFDLSKESLTRAKNYDSIYQKPNKKKKRK